MDCIYLVALSCLQASGLAGWPFHEFTVGKDLHHLDLLGHDLKQTKDHKSGQITTHSPKPMGFVGWIPKQKHHHLTF